MGYWSGMHGGWGWGMGIMMILWFGLAVVALIFAVRLLRGYLPRPPAEDALAILKRRYAAGELTEEAYRRMKREIE